MTTLTKLSNESLDVLTELIECIEGAVADGSWKIKSSNDPQTALSNAKALRTKILIALLNEVPQTYETAKSIEASTMAMHVWMVGSDDAKGEVK